MKIKRVPNLPSVFELSDISIPDDYTIDNLRKYSSFTADGYGRESAQSWYDDKTENFIMNLGREVNSRLKDMLTKEDVSTWWPFDYVKNYEMYINGEPTKGKGISFIIDKGGFNMGYHVDNGLSIATWIINVKDNPNAHTVYANKDVMEWEEIYRGPDKKGTGVLHINRPELYHCGINEGTEERAVLIGYFEIKN